MNDEILKYYKVTDAQTLALINAEFAIRENLKKRVEAVGKKYGFECARQSESLRFGLEITGFAMLANKVDQLDKSKFSVGRGKPQLDSDGCQVVIVKPKKQFERAFDLECGVKHFNYHNLFKILHPTCESIWSFGDGMNWKNKECFYFCSKLPTIDEAIEITASEFQQGVKSRDEVAK